MVLVPRAYSFNKQKPEKSTANIKLIFLQYLDIILFNKLVVWLDNSSSKAGKPCNIENNKD